MKEFRVITTGETIEGTLDGTDEMFEGNDFYQILTTRNGEKFKAFYSIEDQPDAADEYGNIIIDRIDYNRISYLIETE